MASLVLSAHVEAVMKQGAASVSKVRGFVGAGPMVGLAVASLFAALSVAAMLQQVGW